MTGFPVSRTTDPLPAAERTAILTDPGFGRYFTDHMVTAQWDAQDGWHDHRVGPRQPFTLDPATAVLHYAQEIFEGLKAYRHSDGSVREVFAAGTAAVVTPVVGFRGEDLEFGVGDGTPGPHTLALREHVLDIQYGRAKDEHGWLRRVL
jgi:hypothetical protein